MEFSASHKRDGPHTSPAEESALRPATRRFGRCPGHVDVRIDVRIDVHVRAVPALVRDLHRQLRPAANLVGILTVVHHVELSAARERESEEWGQPF